MSSRKTIIRRQANTAASHFSGDLSPLLKRIYTSRDIFTDTDTSTALSDLLSPAGLKGIEEALALLMTAFQQQQRVLVIGDFDADGATSCALAVSALSAMGLQQVDFLVPNRFEYGYGLTPQIVDVAVNYCPDLIITVDNGISSLAGVKAANSHSIKVLVTDHHLPGRELPAAAAIVNPNQPGCGFASKNLAGVGVIFYVLSALRSRLREQGWFVQQQLPEPNLADYLDLVALGTVADVVPLDKNNRILVEQGLRRIRAGKTRPGIRYLLELANRKLSRVVSSDLAFALGPRLNAVGRLDDMTLGIQCLLTDDELIAEQLAQQMDEMNRDRKVIERSMQQEAMQSLAAIHFEAAVQNDMPFGLCLYQSGWHQGVIGILASRIKEKYHRPVIAFADEEDGVSIKGSARSIHGFHIRDALDAIAARHPELLQKFGGHAMAAGLSISKDHYPLFAKAFDDEVRRQLQAEQLQAVLYTDGMLEEEDFTLDNAALLRQVLPWGQHCTEPLFDGDFIVHQQRLVADHHLKMTVAPTHQPDRLLDAIAFHIDNRQWPDPACSAVKLVYRLDVNEFRGVESLQLLVEYIEPLAQC